MLYFGILLTPYIWDRWLLHLDLTLSRWAYMSTVKWEFRFFRKGSVIFLEKLRTILPVAPHQNIIYCPQEDKKKYAPPPFVEISHVWFYTFVQSGLGQSWIQRFTHYTSPPTTTTTHRNFFEGFRHARSLRFGIKASLWSRIKKTNHSLQNF